MPNVKSAIDVAHSGTGNVEGVDMERASSLDVLRPIQPRDPPAMPSRDSLLHGRPLREVVETAMADRSFTKKSQAVMPDTPMKPAFSMSEAASAARTHRRGRSMGGAFPSRSPLFPTPPQTSFSATFHMPNTEAPRARTAAHGFGMGLPRTDLRRHHRSASERIPVTSPTLPFLDEPRATGDPNDVFENSESPSRPAMCEADYSLPSLRREQPVRRSRHAHIAPNPFVAMAPVPQPTDELQDTPMTEAPSLVRAMDSPNNCFASPLASRSGPSAPTASPPRLSWESAAYDTPTARDTSGLGPGTAPPTVLHTGSLYGSEASPLPALGEASPEAMTPITPTRKPSAHLKWFEAAPAGSPSQPYGGTQARKHKAQRPRHSEPAGTLQTPPPARASTVAQSEPAHARNRKESVRRSREPVRGAVRHRVRAGPG